MSNSLDPNQARRIVGPDLGPNCLPRLSANDTGRQRVKVNNIPSKVSGAPWEHQVQEKPSDTCSCWLPWLPKR